MSAQALVWTFPADGQWHARCLVGESVVVASQKPGEVEVHTLADQSTSSLWWELRTVTPGLYAPDPPAGYVGSVVVPYVGVRHVFARRVARGPES